MPRPGPNELVRRLLRRKKIAALMARGVVCSMDIQARIGAENQVRTIQRDMVAVREQWRQDIDLDVTEHVSRKLKEIRAVREEAMAAWERSKTEKQSTRSKNGVDEVRKEFREGDPRYLAIVLECDKQERDLLIPKVIQHKVDATVNGVVLMWDAMEAPPAFVDPLIARIEQEERQGINGQVVDKALDPPGGDGS